MEERQEGSRSDWVIPIIIVATFFYALEKIRELV